MLTERFSEKEVALLFAAFCRRNAAYCIGIALFPTLNRVISIFLYVFY